MFDWLKYLVFFMMTNDNASSSTADGPPCLIVLGMAGAGKTSFIQVRKIVETAY
jgi:hypothetical protein